MTTRKVPTDHLKPVDRKPAGDPEPFDATALLEEIKADGKWFALQGKRFFLPVPTAWPDTAFVAAQAGDVSGTARHVLGDEAYERFVALGGNGVFLQQLVEQLHGASMGESSASSSS